MFVLVPCVEHIELKKIHISYPQNIFFQRQTCPTLCLKIAICGQHWFFCYHLKKTAAESHRMLVEAYGDHALSQTQCKKWFRNFKAGDFDIRNKERGRPGKKREDAELQELLDEDATRRSIRNAINNK